MKDQSVTMNERKRNWPMGICLLCGLPGVGKSTLAAALRWLKWKLQLFHCFKTGKRYMEQLMQSLWKQHRHHLLQCLEHLLESLSSCSLLQAPNDVPVRLWKRFCQCLACHGLSMRYEVYQLARKYSLGFCQLYLQCSVDSCLQRNKGRPHPVLDETIILMEKKIEKPNPEKNKWEENSLFLDSSGGCPADDTQIMDLLNQALENPVQTVDDDNEERERDREICAANLIHQADQSLRRLISETMQTLKGSFASQDCKKIAKELQCVKRNALEQLRQHITLKTDLYGKEDKSFNVTSYFAEEKERILQPYLC